MRRLIAIIMMTALAGAPVLAGNVTVFEGGANEAVADIRAPELSGVINLSLPVNRHVTIATLNVSNILPGPGSAEYPTDVAIYLNDTAIWGFNSSAFGELGRVSSLNGNATDMTLNANSTGGKSSGTIRLMRNAQIENASVTLTGTGPGGWKELLSMQQAGPNDEFGFRAKGVGDVNGDGYDDVVVSAFNANNVEGTAYLFLGGQTMDSFADLTLNGANANDKFGWSVCDRCDLNGDGFCDVIIGAPDSNSLAGAVYVYYGGPNIVNKNAPDLTLDWPIAQEHFGTGLSCAGDVNHDGFDDLVVGCPGNSSLASNAGCACIYFGGPDVDNVTDVMLMSSVKEDRFGRSVAGAGDVNGDGIDDIIVGAFATASGLPGNAYLFYGRSSWPTNESNPNVTFPGEYTGDLYGNWVSGAGDVNHDGFDDVLVGAYASSFNGLLAGSAYLYYGGSNMSAQPGLTIRGANAGDELGVPVEEIGDINRDGYDDIAVGASFESPNQVTGAGAVHVLYGSKNMDAGTDEYYAGTRLNGNFALVADAGDVNNDGFPEIVIGEPGAQGNNIQGMAYIYTWRYDGIKCPSLELGPNTVWSDQWFMNGTVTLNLTQKLRDYMQYTGSSGSDAYGNSYVDIPISIASEYWGRLTLSNITIRYNYETTVLDLSKPLNDYIVAHRSEADVAGNITVPIRLASRTPGTLKLSDLSIVTDDPPVLRATIPGVKMDEDTANPRLLSLWPYFVDDFDAKEKLNYSIVSATNSSRVKLGIVENQFLSVDASNADNWTGTLGIIVGAADRWGGTTLSNQFDVIITNVPDPPVITSWPQLNATPGEKYVYQVTAVDGDNDTPTYGLAEFPPNMTIGPSTGLVQWMPSAGGKFPVVVSVSDGVFTVFQTFKISVPNRPPRIINTTVPDAIANISYNYNIQVVDDDNDTLVFSLVSQIEGMTIDASSGQLSWTPTQAGEYPVTVSISDGKNTTTYVFEIKVLPGNRAPVFTSRPITEAVAGLLYLYYANATDPDGDPLTFSLVDTPAGMVVDSSNGKVSWTPVATGTYTVRMNVTDGKGGEASQAFAIVVREKVGPAMEILHPLEGERLSGRITVAGMAVKGTLEIVKMQLRIDSGKWIDLPGNSTWQYIVDTTRLTNGKHALEARAYDGNDYSEKTTRGFVVDNPKTESGVPVPLAVVSALVVGAICAAATALLMRRKGPGGGEAKQGPVKQGEPVEEHPAVEGIYKG